MNNLKRCLFLDRDGVINLDRGYISRPSEFEFNPDIFDVCRKATEFGWLIVVVTNQGGIGRGYLSESEFQYLSDWMIRKFREQGAEINKVYHCPYHPQATITAYQGEHFWRKPNPGMLLAAKDKFNIDMASSILVGDSPRDLIAAHRAGIAQKILYTGLGAKPYSPSAGENTRQYSMEFPYEESSNLNAIAGLLAAARRN